MILDKHPNQHPLVVLFLTRKFPIVAGMNWLQERGHIADECVDPRDVLAVLTKAGALWAASPAWLARFS